MDRHSTMGISPSERRWLRFRDLLPPSLVPPLDNGAAEAILTSPPLPNHAVPLLLQLSPPPRLAAPPLPPAVTQNDAAEDWQITSIYLSPSASLCSTLEGGGGEGVHRIPDAAVNNNAPVLASLPLEEETNPEDVFYSPQPSYTAAMRMHTPSHHGWTYEAIQSCARRSQLVPLEAALSMRGDCPTLLRTVQRRLASLRVTTTDTSSSSSSSLIMSLSTTTTTTTALSTMHLRPATTEPSSSATNHCLPEEKHPAATNSHSSSPLVEQPRAVETRPTPMPNRRNEETPKTHRRDRRLREHGLLLTAMEDRMHESMQQNLTLRQQVHSLQVQLQRVQADRALLLETMQSMFYQIAQDPDNGTNLYRFLAHSKRLFLRQQEQLLQLETRSEPISTTPPPPEGHRSVRDQHYQRIIAELKEQLRRTQRGVSVLQQQQYRQCRRWPQRGYRSPHDAMTTTPFPHRRQRDKDMATPKNQSGCGRSDMEPTSLSLRDTLRGTPHPIHSGDATPNSTIKRGNVTPQSTQRGDATLGVATPHRSAHPRRDATPLSNRTKCGDAAPTRGHATPHRSATQSGDAVPITGHATPHRSATKSGDATPLAKTTKLEEPGDATTSAPATIEKENQRSQLRISLVRAAGGRRGLQQTLRQIRSPHPQPVESYQAKLDRMRIRPRPLL